MVSTLLDNLIRDICTRSPSTPIDAAAAYQTVPLAAGRVGPVGNYPETRYFIRRPSIRLFRSCCGGFHLAAYGNLLGTVRASSTLRALVDWSNGLMAENAHGLTVPSILLAPMT